MPKPDVIVTGATGLIGRWLVPELSKKNQNVAVFMRNASSQSDEYLSWINNHDGDPARVTFHELDLNASDMELSGLDLSAVKDVYHLAARYEFGLSKSQAREVNVTGSINFLRLCREIPNLRRFVFVTGYLAATHAKTIQAAPKNRQQSLIERHYDQTGAYEASKVEENILLQKEAKALGIPYTIVNPSAVTGDCRTGETTQFIGPAELVSDLFFGKLPALVGGPGIFVPLISVDYVARFMAKIPEFEETIGQSYWLLDQNTPNLPGLVEKIGNHMGTDFPTKSIPKALIKALPKAITGTDPEALSFLTNLRYDTKNTQKLTKKMNIAMPDFQTSLEAWIDFLVSKNFGKSTHNKPGYLTDIAGSKTFLVGKLQAADYILLHGLPLDSQSWSALETTLKGNIVRADLPGHGRSAAANPTPLFWMEKLLKNTKTKPIIIAHSLGCEYAIRYAHAHRDKISHIILISPFFLQSRASLVMRTPFLFTPIIRTMGAKKIIAAATGIQDQSSQLIASAAQNLQRPGKARRFARELARASSISLRKELLDILSSANAPATIIVGESDPLVTKIIGHKIHTIANAGHYPQLSQTDQIAKIINNLKLCDNEI